MMRFDGVYLVKMCERGGYSIVYVCLYAVLFFLPLPHDAFPRHVIQTLCIHSVTVYTTIKRAVAAYIHFYDIL